MDWAKEAVNYLNSQLDNLSVYHTAPDSKPDEFVTLRLSTTLAYNKVAVQPQFIIKAWARSRARAAEIADAIRMAMFWADENVDNVFGVSMVGDYREMTPPLGYEQRVLTIQWNTNE